MNLRIAKYLADLDGILIRAALEIRIGFFENLDFVTYFEGRVGCGLVLLAGEGGVALGAFELAGEVCDLLFEVNVGDERGVGDGGILPEEGAGLGYLFFEIADLAFILVDVGEGTLELGLGLLELTLVHVFALGDVELELAEGFALLFPVGLQAALAFHPALEVGGFELDFLDQFFSSLVQSVSQAI